MSLEKTQAKLQAFLSQENIYVTIRDFYSSTIISRFNRWFDESTYADKDWTGELCYRDKRDIVYEWAVGEYIDTEPADHMHLVDYMQSINGDTTRALNDQELTLAIVWLLDRLEEKL